MVRGVQGMFRPPVVAERPLSALRPLPGLGPAKPIIVHHSRTLLGTVAREPDSKILSVEAARSPKGNATLVRLPVATIRPLARLSDEEECQNGNTIAKLARHGRWELPSYPRSEFFVESHRQATGSVPLSPTAKPLLGTMA